MEGVRGDKEIYDTIHLYMEGIIMAKDGEMLANTLNAAATKDKQTLKLYFKNTEDCGINEDQIN